MKRRTLETFIRGMLPDHPAARYTVTTYEMTHDGEMWSVNTPFRIATDADLDETLRAARGRWEVFKVNYHPRALVRDIDDIGDMPGEWEIEADMIPFLGIRQTVKFSVVVGNIGTVYEGTDPTEAQRTFAKYLDQSAGGYGRAAGEPVTLTANGEPVTEYTP